MFITAVCVIRNQMNASAFRDLWARGMLSIYNKEEYSTVVLGQVSFDNKRSR